jgi:hypothetical protein
VRQPEDAIRRNATWRRKSPRLPRSSAASCWSEHRSAQEQRLHSDFHIPPMCDPHQPREMCSVDGTSAWVGVVRSTERKRELRACLAFKTDAFLFLAHLGQTAEAKWFETDKIGFGMAVALVTDEIKKEGACTHELGSGKRKLEASQRQS